MKGDFSKWKSDPYDNFTGVLHQQGRVLLDQDWNAAQAIAGSLRRLHARDSIGAHVAAVPVEAGDSFRVIQASMDGTKANVTLHPGRVWVDGWVLQREGSVPYTRPIAYFDPPVQTPPADPSTIGAGVRDAVVLDVWEEEINAFQDPEELIEPALGGVDTTERIRLSHELRLLRLAPGDDCSNLAAKLSDDFSAKGRLTVTPAPTTTIAGPCPVALGGGYTGFEHYLFRVEVDEPDAGDQARFKWSRFNGALVGRGTFDNAAQTISIRANDQIINHCGLPGFYLEALKQDSLTGRWVVRFTADATLSADGQLQLTGVSGSWPGDPNGRAFFRLWDGRALIGDFPTGLAHPNELVPGLGIRLALDAPSSGNANYRPGDFWTFPVRTSGTEGFDPATQWPDSAPPQGVHHHRVPLAILNWNGAATTIRAPAQIDDCRRRFPPLSEIRQACCLRVAPGEDLHAAVRKVTREGGGCICLLPGEHRLTRPLDLSGQTGIHFRGAGVATRLNVRGLGAAAFNLSRTHDIHFESLAIVSVSGSPVWSCNATTELTLRDLFVYSTFRRGPHALIRNTGGAGSRWLLEDCVFVGPTGIAGTALYQSEIHGCYWFGLESGIDMQNLLEVELRNNKWFGVSERDLRDLETLAARLETATVLADRNVYEMLLDFLLQQTAETVGTRYTAVDLSGAFDLQLAGNTMGGRDGLRCEILENSKICDNEFLTTVFGASCGLVHGLQFSRNLVGSRSAGQQPGIQSQVGLRIASDAIDCKITDNRFENVREGIVFESDRDGQKETIRDFSAKLLGGRAAENVNVKSLLAGSRKKTASGQNKQVLLPSTYFRVGKCERVSIEGNTLRAGTAGIEWSGTKSIVDFRVVGNAFFDCQEAAIQIEPEDLLFFLAQPVETRVRLIENNRFEIYGPAVRSTLGGVRVERNDIRIKQPAIQFVPFLVAGNLLAERVYASNVLSKAIVDNDVPGMRMAAKNEMAAAASNPGSINAKTFSQEASQKILSNHPPFQGDVAADSMFVMKSLADAEALPLLVNLAALDVFRGNLKQEGYAINLSGIQNRVNNNHVNSSNPSMDGGVLFHLLSGEARGNEIAVNRIGLMMNAKTAQGRENVNIEGNKITVFGPATSGGTSEPAYALAIPSLQPGSLSILDNYFEGSVMVGAEPFSSLGLKSDTNVVTSNVMKVYNALKMDSGVFPYAVSQKAKAATTTPATIIDQPVVVGLILHAWLLDPHRDRPVVQFADNRVVRGWVAIAQSTGGAFWTPDNLENQAHRALVLNLSGNVFDYWARVVGRDVILVSNHSQMPIQYRVGRELQQAANVPSPQPIQ